MSKNKHRKFAEINSFANVVQPGYRFPVSDYHLKGFWNSRFFHNPNPVILELGCGKGEYTVGLAEAYPHQNFIGVDIKGNRMWTGAKNALESGMTNVGFLRIRAEHLSCFFAPGEIDGIWITFPDPQPNKPKERKRFTSPRFLEIYKAFLKPFAPICLKTDNRELFEYSLEVIKSQGCNLHTATFDLYGEPVDVDPLVLNIQTYYESQFLREGKKICFARFDLGV